MSIPQLVPRVIYGHRTNVLNNAYFITDDEIVYAGAAVLIIQSIKTNAQKYLMLPENCLLHRLLISPQRGYIAILVTMKGASHILIYDSFTLSKKRTLTLPPEANTKTIVSYCFSYDQRFVMVISGDPDWMMLAFNWERGKIETSTKANLLTNPLAPVREVVCSPVDTSIIVIYGSGIFRLMNMQETVWRQYGFQKAENFDITSCCFLGGDRILCGTADGLLLLIDLGELKYIFEAEVVNYMNARADKEEEFVGAVNSSMLLDRAKAIEEEEVKRDRTVRALTPLTNGFAYAVESVVHFFEKISVHKYKKRNMYKITDKDFRENQSINIHAVMHLAVNVSETKMMATCLRSQLYEVKLWGPEMSLAGVVPFTHLWFSLHSGRIGDLTVCLWKPIFMTSGAIDRTVRVWNYETMCLEMVKQYQDDIYSICLHPTGLYAAIGFPDKLRFMVVLIDDLQVTKEIPIRECPKSAFNTHGHLLAAVNRNVIQIYNIITCQNVVNLKGHSRSITCLKWTSDDRKLISCGLDGAIYEWDMINFKRIGEIIHKDVSYLGCAVLSNGKNIFAVGTDDQLKEFRASNVLRSMSLSLKKLTHVIISRSDLMMFVAGFDGWIMSIKMPIEEPPEYELFQMHSCKIERMCLTMDDRTLITCSESGTVCIWSLENIEGRTIAIDKDFQYFNEILISKSDLEEKIASIKDLTQRTFELEMEHAYQMSHLRVIYKEKIKDIQETYTQAVEELKETLEILETNHNTELNNINSDLNVMKERHEAEMLETEGKYNAELIVEYDKVVELERLKEKVTQDFETKLAELQASKEKTIEELTRINESKLYNLNKMVEEAREEINKEVAQHEELSRQIEDGNDEEIETLKSKFEKTLKAARENNMRLKGESGVFKKKIISCEKERDLFQMEIINVTSDIEKSKNTTLSLEQEILDLKKEVNERDLRIQEKEKQIYDLKRTEQEYERHKFVLNYMIKGLKNQIEPMNTEIRVKKETIADMEVELYDLQKINISLDTNLGIMREKLSNTYKTLHLYKSKCNAVLKVIEKVKRDIFMASGIAQDYKKLKDGVKKLYFKYISDKNFGKALRAEEECTVELERQKVYLQEIVNILEQQVEISKRVSYGEGMIYMEMNRSLIEEINKIRKKLKASQSKIQEIETLMCIKLAKIYSPRQAHELVQKALQTREEIKEECEIKMEEAATKASIMREEITSIYKRIIELENVLLSGESSQKKKRRKETLKFDIPSII